jgi:hypothetical protein
VSAERCLRDGAASGHRTLSFQLNARRQSRENSASAVRQLQSFSQTEGENHELLT